MEVSLTPLLPAVFFGLCGPSAYIHNREETAVVGQHYLLSLYPRGWLRGAVLPIIFDDNGCNKLCGG